MRATDKVRELLRSDSLDWKAIGEALDELDAAPFRVAEDIAALTDAEVHEVIIAEVYMPAFEGLARHATGEDLALWDLIGPGMRTAWAGAVRAMLLKHYPGDDPRVFLAVNRDPVVGPVIRRGTRPEVQADIEAAMAAAFAPLVRLMRRR